MTTIALVSRKGGAGKSTLAAHLAVEAERDGEQVAIIDADPQGTLSNWRNRREAATPAGINTTIDQLKPQLRALKAQGFSLVIIDTRGDETEEIAAVAKAADLVICPVRPSPADIETVSRTLGILQTAKTPFVFVVNAAPVRGRIIDSAVMALSQHGAIVGMIRTRNAYMESLLYGQTAPETEPNGPAAHEIAELWQNVKKHISAQLRN